MKIKEISKAIILVVLSMLILFGSQMAVFATGDTWVTKASMPTGRYGLGVAEVNGKIYAIGGQVNGGVYSNKVEEYDSTTNQWTTKTNIPTERYGFGIATVNGKIYVIGGSSNAVVYSNEVEEYDPITDSWATKANMPTARIALTTAVVNGKIYAIGGQANETSYSDKVEEYDPTTNSWTEKTNMPQGCYSLDATQLNNKIYVVGGRSSSENFSTKVREYDPLLDTWQDKAGLPTGTGSLAVVSLNGKIYAIGGEEVGGSISNKLQEYNPDTNGWANKASMSSPRFFHDAVVSNNKIYVIGGYYNSTYLNTVEEYTPSITIPDAPVLNGTAGNAVVNLSWNSISDATGYNVKRGTTSSNWTIIANGITETTYTDTNVTNGTTYYYVVTAVNAGGESTESNEVVLTPQDPDAFTGNKAILTITMSNGAQKEYDMTITEINNFLDWFDNRANEIGKAYYMIKKAYNAGPFASRRDYLVFSRIQDFEICDYNQ